MTYEALINLREVTPQPWATDAACKGMNPEWFFPERGQESPNTARVCRGCPVRMECLMWAIENNETHGWWGGAAPRLRRRLRGGMLRAKRLGVPWRVEFGPDGPRQFVDGVEVVERLVKVGGRLRADQVRDIRAMWKAKIPVRDIAEKHRCTERAVRNILTGATWSHVT